jgi:hypothetical protein
MMVAPIQQIDARGIIERKDLTNMRSVWLIRSSPADATSEVLQDFLRRQFPFEQSTNYGAGVDLFVYSRAASAPTADAVEPR